MYILKQPLAQPKYNRDAKGEDFEEEFVHFDESILLVELENWGCHLSGVVLLQK